MSSLVSAISSVLQNATPEVIRRTADFQPNVWGDRFVSYMPEDEISRNRKEERIRELKEEVKRKLLAVDVEPSYQLNIIDAIQRLGVEYHFEKEIQDILLHIYEKHHEVTNNDLDDLYIVSLNFRLLRQQGYNVSCDIFSKYKDNDGNFIESLVGDTLGVLELYEATHLRKHGEDILDEAFAFTSSHLEIMKTKHLSKPLASQVAHALKQPIRKGLPRLEARHYMSIYHEIGSHNKALLEFAKMDFNMVQSLHKKELSNIARWWKDLDFATKLPFVRNRVVEGYFWILGVYFEPQYSLARKIMTKVFAMTSVIDDIYDAYGTIEELELFTQQIERWSLTSIDQLPDYMKLCYQGLLDVYEEIENEMTKQGRSYHIYYAQKEMKNQVKHYFEEAQWFNKKYQPTMEEYMRLAIKTSGYFLLTTISFVGMGDIVTKNAFEWVCNDPKLVTASSIICRLMDDIVSHKFEQKRGHVVSAVECYMKEYGVSEQQAYDELRMQVVNAWKDVNEELLKPTNMPMPLLTRVLNLARVMDVVYKEEDEYTHVGKQMRDRIASLLIDPVVI